MKTYATAMVYAAFCNLHFALPAPMHSAGRTDAPHRSLRPWHTDWQGYACG